jgi:hypothetical protein
VAALPNRLLSSTSVQRITVRSQFAAVHAGGRRARIEQIETSQRREEDHGGIFYVGDLVNVGLCQASLPAGPATSTHSARRG